MRSDRALLGARIQRIRQLAGESNSSSDSLEAAALALSVLHDSVGSAHPLTSEVKNSLEKSSWQRARGAARTVVQLYDEDRLQSPRLLIAHELEGELLDIAQRQVQAAERAKTDGERTVALAVAAFLAGAALEDALRRLCDSHQLTYDSQRSSISRLQSALYQPSKQVEIISQSENKQITAWGDTRNKADHGQFGDLSLSEVIAMVVGVRGFIDRHLP